MKKHLVVIAPYFFPKIGGLENYAYNVARRFHESGEYRVSVVTSDHERKGYTKESLDGMTVHRLPIWFILSNTPINPMWYFWFKRFFATEKPDVVNIHTPVPFMADVAVLAASGQMTTVLTYHAGSMLKKKWLADIIIGLYEKVFLPALFRRVSVIVPVSEHFFTTPLGKKFTHKTHLIRPGVDTKVYTPTPLPTDSKIVTFVGRVEHSSAWKGIEELLVAMKIVLAQQPDAKLEIVGGGDAVEHFRARALELSIGSAVRMCGVQMGNDLVAAYQRSSVVVLPSTSEAEQSSVVLIEAMASARPVIGTRIGGTPKIIQEGENGLLVAPKDSTALAAAILLVLSDTELAQQLSDGGVRSAKAVDWESQLKKYRALFDSQVLP